GGSGGGGGLGPLAVVSVTPTEVWADDGATLVITGGGFQVGAQLLIGTTLIDQSDVKSAAVLNATVAPRQLKPGVYDVTVLNLTGERASLPMALTVLSGSMAKAGCGCTAVEPTSLLLMGLLLLRRPRRRS
ncbi:MAG: IPT/TIG domain-containing protein, partial [Myxococcota bacterium]